MDAMVSEEIKEYDEFTQGAQDGGGCTIALSCFGQDEEGGLVQRDAGSTFDWQRKSFAVGKDDGADDEPRCHLLTLSLVTVCLYRAPAFEKCK